MTREMRTDLALAVCSAGVFVLWLFPFVILEPWPARLEPIGYVGAVVFAGLGIRSYIQRPMAERPKKPANRFGLMSLYCLIWGAVGYVFVWFVVPVILAGVFGVRPLRPCWFKQMPSGPQPLAGEGADIHCLSMVKAALHITGYALQIAPRVPPQARRPSQAQI